MKKRDLKKLALMGVAGGLLIANQSEVQAQEAQSGASEGQLLGQLSQGGRALYQSLDAEGQALARLVADRSCGCGGNQQNINYGGCGSKCGSASTSSHGANHSCGSAGGCGHGQGMSQGYQGHSCGGGDMMNQGGYQGQHCASGQPVYQGGQAHCASGNPNYQGGQHCASKNQGQPPKQSGQPTQQPQNPSAYRAGDQRKQASGLQANAQMTEQQLVSQLNAEGKKMYDALTPEGKRLALQLASQDCKGKNACAGLGSGATDQNSCAGKNSCAGTSPGPFTDKNQAVKVASMKDKRVTSLRTNY